MTARESARRMPTTGRGRETRQRLLDAAERIFGEEGFHEASVTQIVAAAEVGQGTFYLYFPTKRDIFVALVEHLASSLRQEIHGATEGLERREEVERAGFRAFFHFVEKHPLSYRIVRQAEFVDQQVFRDYYRSLAHGYERGLRAAAGTGEFRSPDAEAVSYALMGIADFIGMRYVLWTGGGHVPDTAFESIMELILHGLLQN